MNSLDKLIFWTAISVIGIWIISPIIRTILGLEFANETYKSNYEEFFFFAIPVALLFTLSGTLKKTDDNLTRFTKVLATITIAGGTIVLMFLSVFADMCTWTNVKTLYLNKKDENIKIIVRDFGCGATDSSPPSTKIKKVQYFTDYFIRSSDIDTATINKNEWYFQN